MVLVNVIIAQPDTEKEKKCGIDECDSMRYPNYQPLTPLPRVGQRPYAIRIHLLALVGRANRGFDSPHDRHPAATRVFLLEPRKWNIRRHLRTIPTTRTTAHNPPRPSCLASAPRQAHRSRLPRDRPHRIWVIAGTVLVGLIAWWVLT